MTKYSSNADLIQVQTDTDLSDLFAGFLPGQVSTETDLTDLLQPTPPAMENVDVALSLAARGLAVCPVRQWGDGDGWKPIARFPELATTDAAKIRKWWRDWPEARVALITGERNGISVLDVDVKNGKDGLLSLATLGFEDHLAMTPIRTRTPSGGYHLFFAYRPDLKATVGKIGPGLDVRNNGGFVVAPDSIKDGKRYQIEGAVLSHGAPLPEWPEALAPAKRPERQSVDIQEASEYHREWARDYLNKRAADVAVTAEGGRQAALNDASLWAGGAGAHGALTRNEAAAVLIEAGKTCGLSESEARDSFDHGWADGLKKPIEVPPDYGSIDDLFDDLPTLAAYAKQAKVGIITTKSGDMKPTLHNAILVLRKVDRDCGFSIRKNDMTGQDEWRAGPMTDADLGLIRVAIEQAGMHNVGADLTASAVQAVAELNRYHPVKDWLDSLSHDGKPRIDRWLTRYLGVGASPYSRAVGRAFLVAMVARVMRPGCKHDHVLVLGGAQGIGKSTACQILGGEYSGDNMPSIRDGAREAGLYLRGHWLVELAELAPSRKAEAEDLKAFLTRATDEIRAPYARRADLVPRQCAFVGTTNETAFLRDASGGRRFWPVTCGGKIETEALAQDRDQLFAEAMAAFRAGEAWHLPPDLEWQAAIEQEAAREEHPWEQPIRRILDGLTEGDGYDRTPKDCVTVAELLTALGVPVERQNGANSKLVANILRLSGWTMRRKNTGNIWARA